MRRCVQKYSQQATPSTNWGTNFTTVSGGCNMEDENMQKTKSIATLPKTAAETENSGC